MNTTSSLSPIGCNFLICCNELSPGYNSTIPAAVPPRGLNNIPRFGSNAYELFLTSPEIVICCNISYSPLNSPPPYCPMLIGAPISPPSGTGHNFTY